jgi:glucoamylase
VVERNGELVLGEAHARELDMNRVRPAVPEIVSFRAALRGQTSHVPHTIRSLVLAALLPALWPAAVAAKPPAPGAPGERHTWAPADKQGFGGAVQLASPVWFTLRQTELTEIYYPDLSTPSLRDLEFVVADGRRLVGRGTVRPLAGSLTYRQVLRGTGWRLEATWITDPRRATVLARVRFNSFSGRPLKLFVLADPAPGNDGDDDLGFSRPSALVAFDDTVASAIRATPRLRRTTSGYAGTTSDPRADLEDGDIDAQYDGTAPGNVVQAAETKLDGVRRRDLTLAIGFGPNAAAARQAAAGRHFNPAARRYASGWSRYLQSVRRPPAPVRESRHMRRLYQQSLMVLAAAEDKAHRGASIASPSMPWVWGTLTLENRPDSGPYHLVWPRDLYHVATAQAAAGDRPAAERLLDFLWRVQKPDGSFWQNTRVDGEPRWMTEQMDQVSLPIVLAWWLGRTGATDWEHVRRAADYVVAGGPESDNERWENQSGWSPNTIATEIAGLVCAAAIARANGDTARAATYEATADAWQAQVESWTATTNGPYSPEPYYVRVTKDGNPNDGTTYSLGDNFPRPVDESEIVDNSFLGLVLFGAKRHDDPVILNSLAVGDSQLRVRTPNGPVWYRFTFDGYGETATGADWNIFPTAERQTFGRLWPLLTGERGEYALIAGRSARPHLRTIARTANDGLMLPEQVWDGRPPESEPVGEGTRSATPLAWTHAQFIRLAWSIARGRPVERPCIVAQRYNTGGC